MTGEPVLIFSDSEVFIEDIKYVFRKRYDFVSSESVMRITDLLNINPAEFMIVDMDMKIEDLNDFLEKLRALSETGLSLLFMISERKKLELEKVLGNVYEFITNAEWIVKPFSRNVLLQAVGRISA